MRFLRTYGVELALIVVLAASVGFFAYLGYGLLKPNVVASEFEGAQALDRAARQLEFGPRITGTESNISMGDWLVQELRSMGWDVVIQPFSVADTVPARNITAIKGGGPQEGPVVILGAAYDSRLFADSDPDPEKHDQPTPGANQNAGGVAVLLELARTLDVEAAGHTICLAFFDAETNAGIEGWDAALGSSHFVKSLNNDIYRCSSPRLAVIVDMVGGADHQIFVERTSAPSLSDAIWGVAGELGFGDWIKPEVKWTTVDAHSPFLQVGIPAAVMVDFDYPHRHTTEDTLEARFQQLGAHRSHTQDLAGAWRSDGAIAVCFVVV